MCQALLDGTVADGTFTELADAPTLCELLELSGRLSTRRDAPAMLQVRRGLVDALLRMEDCLTEELVAMAAQVRSPLPACGGYGPF